MHADELDADGVQLNPRTSGYASIAGSAVHAVAHLEPGSERVDAVDAWCENKIAESEESDEVIIADSILEDWDDVRSIARSCLAKLDTLEEAEKFRSDDPAILREQYMNTGDYFKDFSLSGHMDLYDPSDRRLLDIKCSGSYTAKRYDGQIGAYTALIAIDDYPKPTTSDILFLPFRDRPPEVVPHDTEYALQHLKNTLATSEHTHKRVIEIAAKKERAVSGDDLPASPGCWACSAKYCRAHGTEFCKVYPKENPL